MKIIHNGNEYGCFDFQCSASTAFLHFVEKPAEEISGELVLCADNGFVLQTINTVDFLRSYWTNNIFVLTNIPEPEYVEPDPDEPVEPEEPTEDVTWDSMAEAITEGVNDV